MHMVTGWLLVVLGDFVWFVVGFFCVFFFFLKLHFYFRYLLAVLILVAGSSYSKLVHK